MSEIQKNSDQYDDPELLTKQRAEQEDVPRMPKTPEEMIASTLDPVSGCVDKITVPLSRLAVGSLSKLQDILLQINTRLLAYLKGDPGLYAHHLLGAALRSAPSNERGALADITAYIVADLNPLFHAAWHEQSNLTTKLTDEIKSHHGIPVTIEEFFAGFDVGEVNNEKVFSFFGALKSIAQEHDLFPLLDTREPELPKEIVITDPLGLEQKEYWLSRQKAYGALYGRDDLSLQELIRSKNAGMLYDLALLDQNTRDEDLAHAVRAIGEWLECEQEQIEGVSDDEFGEYVAGLHFAYGDPETLIALLNSMETLKQKAPEFFVRILGRSPRPAGLEDTRSDLFGNSIQAALYRSLHLQTGKGTEEYESLQSFLNGLTRMEARQDVIAPVSDEEFSQMEKVFDDYMEQAGDSDLRLFPAIMFGEKRRAYLMGKMLERVSAENRERLLGELRDATPREFVRLMNSKRLLPGGYLGILAYIDKEFPPDVKAVLLERGLPSSSEDERLGIIAAVDGVGALSVPKIRSALSVGIALAIPNITLDDIKKVRKYQKVVATGRSRWEDIENLLWKTTPSEKLVRGDEFYDYLKKATDRMKKRGRRGMDNRSATQADVEVILEILNAHPDITREQWQQWMHGLQWRDSGGGIERKKREFRDVKSALAPIFHNFFSLIQVTEARSHFFQLFERLFPKAAEMVEKSPLYITQTMPAVYYQWLENEKDDGSPNSRKTSERTLDAFRDVSHGEELVDAQKMPMKNLHTLSKLFSPNTLANSLDSFFILQPGAFDLFYATLPDEGRSQFLKQLSYNERVKMRSGVALHNYQQMQFHFVLLRECNRAIPDSDEYRDLRRFISFAEYETTRADEPMHRVRFHDDEQRWVLEEYIDREHEADSGWTIIAKG